MASLFTYTCMYACTCIRTCVHAHHGHSVLCWGQLFPWFQLVDVAEISLIRSYIIMIIWSCTCCIDVWSRDTPSANSVRFTHVIYMIYGCHWLAECSLCVRYVPATSRSRHALYNAPETHHCTLCVWRTCLMVAICALTFSSLLLAVSWCFHMFQFSFL